MTSPRLLTLLALCAPAALTTTARAAERPATGTSPTPSIYHVAPATWRAGQSYQLTAEVIADWTYERLWADVRPAAGHARDLVFADFAEACQTIMDARYLPSTGACEVPLLHTQGRRWVARLPSAFVQPPGLTYFIAAQAPGAEARAHFASAAQPHPVLVHGESPRTQRQERLERHEGHRNQLAVRGEATVFGAARVQTPRGPRRSDSLSDRFGGGELVYTHRLLKTLYAFRIGISTLWGHRGTYEGHTGTESIARDGDDEPGLVLGFGELDFELHRSLSFALRLSLGASAEAFAGGAGGAIRIGPHFATHAEIGVDYVSAGGARGWLKFAWDTVPSVPMALTIELTELPEGGWNELGTRLLYDLGVDLSEAVTLLARVGYAKRTSSHEGGFVAGLATTWEF